MDTWNITVKGMLKAELKRRGISYRTLSDALNAIGVKATETSIKQKIHHGTFSAAFLLQCMTAIGCSIIRLDD